SGAVLVSGGYDYDYPGASTEVFDIDALSPLGVPCAAPSECASGFCVGGVCCETACDGACESCNLNFYAGTCSPSPSGAPSDDGDACTLGDACMSGACIGSSTVQCAGDACNDPGSCAPATGICSMIPKPDGTPCALGTCFGGVCMLGSTSSSTSSGAGG